MEAIDEAISRARSHECADGNDNGTDRDIDTLSGLAALRQPEPLVDLLAGPAWARTWAEAIVCYWETEHASGTIDVDEPLCLIDFAPGRGALAWLLLEAIEACLQSSALEHVPLRYVACGENDAALALLRANPRLAPRLAAGSFQAVQWHAGEALPRCLGRAASAPVQTINPVVALAAGAFRSDRAALCAAHYGQWLRADIRRTRCLPDASDGSCGLAYTWCPTAPTALGDQWAPLIERYLANLISAPLTIPIGAAARLDALRRMSADRFLLLCCDMGATTEGALRDGVLAPPDSWNAGVSLAPVNFDALRWYQRTAWVHECEQDDHRLVHYAAWSRAGEAPPSRAQCAMRRILDAWAPLVAVHLARVASALGTSESRAMPLALLRASSCDPRVLRALIASWPDGLPKLDAESIPPWREVLDETWRHHLPPALFSASDTRFELALAAFAVALEDWGLAKEILRTILPLTLDVLSVLRYLAHCLAESGELDAALGELGRACTLAPDDEWCRAAREQFAQRAARRHALSWYRPDLARDGDLTLEPLGVEHARAFFACYAGPHIAAMTNLPALCDIDETRAWIEADANEAGRVSCAIVDARLGFIGVASFSCADGAGYFYFWLGSQAQGRGFGTRAARRLFALAEASGIDTFFTAAYPSNGRSLRALARLGFQRLPVRSEQDPDSVFFHRPAPGSRTDLDDPRDAVARLEQLCGAIDAPGTFVITLTHGGLS